MKVWATLSKHFGAAKYFIIIDTKNGNLKVCKNKNLNHTHGDCQPLLALGNNHVDAIVTITIGNKALLELHSSSIKVFKAVEGNIKKNCIEVMNKKLMELLTGKICKGHEHDGEGHSCSH